MKKGMCITYEVDGALYVNVTNRCSNRCDFCIRNNGDGAYGSDPLWLIREPTVDEIRDSILSRELDRYREIVFCGYGEPTYRLYDICEVVKSLRSLHDNLKIRINTNGQSDLILGENTAPLYRDIFDTVSISLNSSSSAGYIEICHPVYKEKAFPAIIAFAENVKKYVQNVAFTVVRQFLSDEELYACEKISARTGVPLRVREYIKAEDG